MIIPFLYPCLIIIYPTDKLNMKLTISRLFSHYSHT